MNIAVVGAGIAGSSVLKTIIDSYPLEKVQAIHVYEPKETVGKGDPYQKDDRMLVMNTSPEGLTVDAEKPHDFLEWLKEKVNHIYNDEGLVPREHFGMYLHDRYSPYFNHEKVHIHHREIENFKVLSEDGDATYTYKLYSNERGCEPFVFDAVFFAPGHPPYADYYDLKGLPNYIGNPYPVSEKLTNFSEEQSIGIIGSGASGLDMVRYLNHYYAFHHPITLFIRDTPFTSTEIPLESKFTAPTMNGKWLKEKSKFFGGKIPLDVMLEQANTDLEKEGVSWHHLVNQYGSGDITENIRAFYEKPQDLAYLQRYIDGITFYLPDMYQSLSASDKGRFQKEYLKDFTHFRSVVPYGTFALILAMLESNKLRITTGLTDIHYSKEAQNFIVIRHGSHAEQVDVMINATGFEMRLEEASKTDSLIDNLYNQELVVPSENGAGVLVSWPDTQVLSRKWGQLNHVYFLGPYISNTQFGNNNIRLNMKQGQRAANHLLQKTIEYRKKKGVTDDRIKKCD